MNPRLSRLFATRIDTQSDADLIEYLPGQIWKITNGKFSGVTVMVVKTETLPRLGRAVHVSILGPMQTPGGAEFDGIPHLPFTPEAMNISDLDFIGQVSDVPENWIDMYDDWRADADMEEAGLFSLSVQEILETIMKKLAWI